jgi:hypothetical protein
VRLSLLALFSLTLAGCPTTDDKPDTDTQDDTSPDGVVDEDGDGFLVSDGDCDDSNADVNPDADERCDGVDNDCDGEIDVDATDMKRGYADADGDGYGDAGTGTSACELPGDYVDDSTDCDDADATVHPDATELCDGLDNDCDATIDEDVTPLWYADGDADGFGDPGTSTSACAAPAGYVGDATDCDDADAAFHPGADESDCADPNDYNCDGSVGYVDADGDSFAACEDCDDAAPATNPGAYESCDGIDDDCDGAIDEDVVDAGTWYLDADLDGSGADAVSVVACDAPAGYVAAGGDCDDTNTLFHPGAAEADCADPTDYNCDGAVAYADDDGDGWAACEDCDDASASVNPSGVEACNDVDDDCDGAVDEDAVDATAWYTDLDLDGYGDAAATVIACDAPAGTVATGDDCDDTSALYNPGADESDCSDPADYNCDGSSAMSDADGDGWAACEDCDDTDADVRPDATELCDGVDDDCDGVVDEADALGATAWYRDADSDGYGDAAGTDTETACDAPIGYAATADDCDDTSTRFHPGADESDCTDPTDYNCDGSSASTDADADGWAACEDCDDSRADVNPDAAEACNSLDDDCDGTTDEPDAVDAATWFADADGDTFGDSAVTTIACDAPAAYVAGATDCDDTRADVFPGAPETCDGSDEDCDGSVDEDSVDAAAWYLDGDTDGFGDADVVADACDAPLGYVADATDCDDAVATVYPGADETCDSVDEDCDGVVDDDAIDVLTWYGDADGDGYGSISTTVDACDAPSGYVAGSSDCDDTTTAIRPGAAETCNDVDDDCDGTIDDAALDASTWYADSDGDGYGSPTVTALSCDAPSGYLAVAGDCDDADPAAGPGGEETCDGTDEDCDGIVDEEPVDGDTWYADVDGDGYGDSADAVIACSAPSGYVANGEDCDDADPATSPGGEETCDGTDEDCDGTVDEADAIGAPSWYADADADGYGDASVGEVACAEPAGFVADATDCDDGTSTVSPGAAETCNSRDDDCDTIVDESATDALTWYADTDGDTYGNLASTSAACTQPSGYVADATDCDDTIGAVHPGATETCNFVDDDCDRTTDEDATDATPWYTDADADGYGAGAATLACVAPSLGVATDDDCDDTRAADNPGATEVCDSHDNDCDGSVDEDASGGTTYYSDSDGDGYGDGLATIVACSAPPAYVTDATDCDDHAAAVNPGATEVCENGLDDECSGDVSGCELSGTDALTTADHTWNGTIANDYVGTAVAGGGDLDGDGYDDIVIASNGYDTSSALQNMGRNYVFHGPIAAGDTLATADATLTGAKSSGDNAGTALAFAGDVDGDGKEDLLVGAHLVNGAATDSGAAYLIHGPASTTTMTPTAGVATAFVGTVAADYVGYSVAGAGDLDGDSLGDVLVGGYGVDSGALTDSGLVGIYYGADLSSSETLTAADVTFSGTIAGQYVGHAVAGAGDVDGDGYEDFLVGSYADDGGGTNAGAAWLVLGPPSATALTPATADATIYGAAAGDYLGVSLAGLGDTNGDGQDDFAVAADHATGGATASGVVYVFTTPPSGTATAVTAGTTLLGVSASDYIGHDIASAGDVNADGTPDLLVGAFGYDAGSASNAGGFYLLYGPFTSGSIATDSALRYGLASDSGSTGSNSNVSLSGGGDVDGDGYDDVLYGATDADPGAINRAGSAWLFGGTGE